MAKRNPNPSLLTQVAVDAVLFSIIRGTLSVLVITREWAPFEGFAALPGSFLRAGETATQTVQRLLHDKAGLAKPTYTEQLYTFDNSDRDPRGQFPTVTYMALVPESLRLGVVQGAQQPRWVPVKELPSLAFDHANIIRYALNRLKAKLEYTNIIYSLLPRQFTLTQLQNVYEIVMAEKLDKRNFRKKYLALGLIRSTGRISRGGQRRPAALYEFKKHRPAELRKFFR